MLLDYNLFEINIGYGFGNINLNKSTRCHSNNKMTSLCTSFLMFPLFTHTHIHTHTHTHSRVRVVNSDKHFERELRQPEETLVVANFTAAG